MEKVAVITGSARGLGRAIATRLSSEGYTIVVHYNKSRAEASEVLGDLRKNSPDSFGISADLKSEKNVDVMFREITDKFGRVDLLVNNVGNFLYKNFNKTTNDEFCDIVESNIYSTFFCSRAVLHLMRKQKSGQIINIGTVGSDTLTVREKSTPYFMAKNALYFLTKAMAWEEAKNGIHVNMISPASLATDIFKPSDFPMGRSARYDDVVKVLLFLISKDAYYINGANIEVAGGFIPGMK
ncbi:SDR family oxidoreductase [Candidatus Curtissbacteria bacterium]|nr:SDR family oxidoreductase [Candidatus Curtissbacteria bacterium]